MDPQRKFELGMKNYLRTSIMYPPSRTIIQDFRRDTQEARAQLVREFWNTAGHKICLYIHVPFCESKCAFCNYATVNTKSKSGAAAIKDRYVKAVIQELNLYARILSSNARLTGLDFGGGTPSLLSVQHFEDIIETVQRNFRKDDGFEISVETTPKIAAQEPDKFKSLADFGINRVSMGVQSSDDTVLKVSKRAIHNRELIRLGAENIRRSNIPLFNVDLMFGMPKQTLTSWEESLLFAVNLGPNIITTYDTVYKNRGIAAFAIKNNCLPTTDDFGRMYDMAYNLLLSAGYHGDYGTINFSNIPGRLGTSRYLENRILHGLSYFGVGNYSSSLVNNVWYFNELDIRKYISLVESGYLPVMDFYELPGRDIIAKYLLLAISYGFINKAIFKKRFGENIERLFGDELKYLLDNGFLLKSAGRYHLAYGKFREMPGIRACFYSDRALEFLKHHDLPV